MNEAQLSKLSGQYLTALRIHFEQGPHARLQGAHELGREAVANGLETLDLARLHEQALGTLLLLECSPVTREDLTKRAEAFFTEANMPIEETHCSALEAGDDWNQVNATLKQRTRELTDSNREIQQQITKRETSEDAFTDSRSAASRLLKDSLVLEASLQKMARKVLSTTEDERKKMCLRLGGEIAQTLLGIKLRMLALNKEIATNDETLTKEIAIIQRLVEDSTGIIKQLAHEFSIENAREAD